MLDRETQDVAAALIELLTSKTLTVATAESCTGGLIAAALTDIAGSSAAVEGGFVTYSNEAKQRMIGVPPEIIDAHGAVSRETAEAMAKGVLANTRADLAVSVTGIAGPTGATPNKPVGLVHFAAASRGGNLIHHEARFGEIGRSEVRRRSVLQAMDMLRRLAEKG